MPNTDCQCGCTPVTVATTAFDPCVCGCECCAKEEKETPPKDASHGREPVAVGSATASTE